MINKKNRLIVNHLCKKDKYLSRVLILFYILSITNAAMKMVLHENGQSIMLVRGLFVILMLYYFIKSIKQFINKGFLFLILLEVTLLLVYSVSILKGNASSSDVLSYAKFSMGVCAPLASIVYAHFDNRNLYNELLKWSYFISILSIISIIGSYYFDPTFTYTMFLSYSLLLPVLLQINQLFVNFKIINFIFVVVSFLVILIWGARGPLFLILVYTSYKVISLPKPTIKNISKIILGGVSIAILLNLALKSMTNYLTNLLHSYGLSSRILNMISHNIIYSGTGRSEIANRAWNMIIQKPLLGWGAVADITRLGGYPHNIFLELAIDYGLLIAGLISIVLIFKMALIFYKPKSIYVDVVVIYILTGFLPLLVSGTYLWSVDFFILIALLGNRNISDLRKRAI